MCNTENSIFTQKSTHVTGSTGNDYEVLFYIEDGKLKASCTCSAGMKGVLCKHVLGIALNDEEIKREMENYGYLKVYADYLEKLEESEKIKKEATNIKKKLERLLIR